MSDDDDTLTNYRAEVSRLFAEIERLRAEVERWKLIASEHERTA